MGTNGQADYMDELGNRSGECGSASGGGEVREDVPWQERLLKRVMGLKPGRYVVVLTIGGGQADWSVGERQRVEK